MLSASPSGHKGNSSIGSAGKRRPARCPPCRAARCDVDVAGSSRTAKPPERLVSGCTPALEPVSRPVGLTRCQPGQAHGQGPASQVSLTPVALVQNQSELQCHPALRQRETPPSPGVTAGHTPPVLSLGLERLLLQDNHLAQILLYKLFPPRSPLTIVCIVIP